MEKKMNPGKITAGMQVIDTISALVGGNPEKILREFASGKGSARCRREFGPWNKDGNCHGFVLVDDAVKLPVQLQIGTEEGLHLYETSIFKSRTLSLRLRYESLTSLKKLRIPVTNEEIRDKLICDIANQIAAVWVGHGINWKNRATKKREEEQIALPFGRLRSLADEEALYLRLVNLRTAKRKESLSEDLRVTKETLPQPTGWGMSPGQKTVSTSKSSGWVKQP